MLRLASSLCFSVLLVMISSWNCVAQELTASQNGAEISLFNGKSLEGWKGDHQWWKVEDGMLVGATTSKRNPEDPSWLITDKAYENFELTLWCKLEGDGNRNSGVYYRGKWNAEKQVLGYEFDLGGWAGEKELWWGELHDPYGRQLSVSDLDKAAIKQLYNKKGWNHVRIRVHGNHIQHWLNGIKTVDWYEEDPSIQKSGFIGFQIHPESKYKVYLRNIVLSPL
nr:DUF1080 domain-containing protein [Allomuricauda sp.]